MLVLSRRDGESIKIGADITVKVFGRNGPLTRIGIDAPKEIPIRRDNAAVVHRVSAALADGRLSELESQLDGEQWYG